MELGGGGGGGGGGEGRTSRGIYNVQLNFTLSPLTMAQDPICYIFAIIGRSLGPQ